jgi:hypothetical protein
MIRRNFRWASEVFAMLDFLIWLVCILHDNHWVLHLYLFHFCLVALQFGKNAKISTLMEAKHYRKKKAQGAMVKCAIKQ